MMKPHLKRWVAVALVLLVIGGAAAVFVPVPPSGTFNEPSVAYEGHSHWQFSRGKVQIVMVGTDRSINGGTYRIEPAGWIWESNGYRSRVHAYCWGLRIEGLKTTGDHLVWRCLHLGTE